MKNLKFSFLLFLIIFLFIELIGYYSLSILKSSNFIIQKKKVLDQSNYNLQKYYFNSYIDHEIFIEKLSNKPDLDLGDKFFKYVSDINNNRLVLFQGDSWSEVLTEDIEIFELVKKFGINNKISIINGGISSFSLSPIIAQLKILKTYYDIKPKIIVLILDQTDLGDDLYRREIFIHKPTKITIDYAKSILVILDDKTLNTIKFFKIFRNYYLYYKELYETNTIENLKFLLKKLYWGITKTPLQLTPLVYGVNEKQENHFYNLLNIYFELANEDIEKLIIVTHPHKNHINNKYKLNLSSLVSNYIKKNKLEKKILHINFSNEIIEKGIDISDFFQKGDIFSHLTQKKYLQYYLPRILNELKNTQLLKK